MFNNISETVQWSSPGRIRNLRTVGRTGNTACFQLKSVYHWWPSCKSRVRCIDLCQLPDCPPVLSNKSMRKTTKLRQGASVWIRKSQCVSPAIMKCAQELIVKTAMIDFADFADFADFDWPSDLAKCASDLLRSVHQLLAATSWTLPATLPRMSGLFVGQQKLNAAHKKLQQRTKNAGIIRYDTTGDPWKCLLWRYTSQEKKRWIPSERPRNHPGHGDILKGSDESTSK